MQLLCALCIAAAVFLTLILVPFRLGLEFVKPEGKSVIMFRLVFEGVVVRRRSYTTFTRKDKPIGKYGWLMDAARPKKLRINISAGFEDAAMAALLCGVLGAGMDALSTRFIQRDISITPIFGRNTFAARLNCIIGFSIANIILAAIKHRRQNNGTDRQYSSNNNVRDQKAG